MSVDIINKLRETVEKFGLAVLAISGSEDDDPAFAYTIGNSLKGYPEFLIIGDFDLMTIKSILNLISETMWKTEIVPDGRFRYNPEVRFDLLARKAGPKAKEEHTLLVDDVLDSNEYEVVQIVICDKSGLFPGEEGVDPLFEVPLI